jgi:hypothetical protein
MVAETRSAEGATEIVRTQSLRVAENPIRLQPYIIFRATEKQSAKGATEA